MTISRRISLAAIVLLSGCADWQSTFKPRAADPPAKATDATAKAKTPPKPPRKEEALRQFEKDRDDAQYQAAVAQWRAGETEACRDLLTKLLARNPDHLQARLLMSEYHLLNTTPLEAMEHAKLAIAKNPNDAQANHSMALVLDAQGNTDAALPYYRRAAELAPDNDVFKLSLQAAEGFALAGANDLAGTAQQGAKNRTVGRASQPDQDGLGRPSYEAAAKAKSGNATTANSAHNNTSTITAISTAGPGSLPGDIAARAAEIKEARMAGEQQIADAEERRRQPVKQVAYVAAMPETTGKTTSNATGLFSVEALQQAMAADPFNTQIPVRAAIVALQNGQPERAVELAQAGLAEYPDCAALQRTLGAAYVRLGDNQRAEAELRRALSLDKSNASTYFLLGCALRKLGKTDEAEQQFEQARRIDPKYGAQNPHPDQGQP